MNRENAVAAVKAIARAQLPGAFAGLRQKAAVVENAFGRTAAMAGVAGLEALGEIAVDLVADIAVLALDRLSQGWPVAVTTAEVGWEERVR